MLIAHVYVSPLYILNPISAIFYFNFFSSSDYVRGILTTNSIYNAAEEKPSNYNKYCIFCIQ